MKTALCALLLAIAPGYAWSQTPASELAAMTAKYKAELDTLETQRAAALAQAQNSYAAALAAAERTATTSGNVAAVSMIANERAAITSGLMPPGFPLGLPKELQGPRKTYLDAGTRIRAAETPRRQAMDAAYLRALGNLAAKGARDPALAGEVEAERQKLLASAPTGTGGNKPNAKSAVINGTFDASDAGSPPKGWTPTQGDGFKVARDGANSVLHAKATQPIYQSVIQDIPVPPKVRNVTVSGRIRGKLVARDPKKPGFGVCLQAVFLDAQEQVTNTWMHFAGAGTDAEWKTVNATEKIPDGMKSLRVMLELKNVAGDFDFDDIAVEFR